MKQYTYNGIVRPITYRNVMYLTIAAQRRWWKQNSVEITPDDNSNP